MNKRRLLSVAASIILTAPLLVEAAQIAPNPNPAGSTIDIINDLFAVNNENPYSNGGTINIDSSSTLTNSVGATLNNFDQTTRVGGTLRFPRAAGAGRRHAEPECVCVGTTSVVRLTVRRWRVIS